MALVYATQVAAEWRNGNTWIAQEYSRKAAVWGIVIGVVLAVFMAVVWGTT